MQGAAREPPGAYWVVREEGFPQRQRRRWPFLDRLLGGAEFLERQHAVEIHDQDERVPDFS